MTLRSDINPSWDLRYIATQCDIRCAIDIFASQMWDLYHIAVTVGSNIAFALKKYRAEHSEAYRHSAFPGVAPMVLRNDINPSWDLRYIATQCDIRFASDIFALQMWDLYHIDTEQSEVISNLSESENISRLRKANISPRLSPPFY